MPQKWTSLGRRTYYWKSLMLLFSSVEEILHYLGHGAEEKNQDESSFNFFSAMEGI